MEVEYKKKFLKELSKLPAEYAKTIEEFVFDNLPNYSSLSDIGKVEKMKWSIIKKKFQMPMK